MKVPFPGRPEYSWCKCEAEAPLKAMPWDYFAKHKNPKAGETLVCFCKFQQIKKKYICMQNSTGGLELAFMIE